MDIQKTLIIDTDVGCDCDDAGALALLHNLASLLKINILAVTHSNSSLNGVACIDVINTYYNRPEIPIGCYKAEGFLDKEEFDTYATKIAEKFNNRYLNNRNVPEAYKLIRQQLTLQAENSVTLVAIGQLKNFALLLSSGPDEISPLSGIELVEKYVKELVIMGGEFENQLYPEYNIKCDIESAKTVVRLCPVPITFCGFEIGEPILSGEAFIEADDFDNPVYWCYKFHEHIPRNSWDQTTIIYAAVGENDCYSISPYGNITVADNGVTKFSECENGKHRYLIQKLPTEKMSKLVNELMIYRKNMSLSVTSGVIKCII